MIAHVKLENGNTITTEINGSPESVRSYYKIGRALNVGCVADNMQKIVELVLMEDGKVIA